MTDRTPGRLAQGIGVLLMGTWLWWAFGWVADLTTVTPVHWALILPQLAIEGVPALAGALVGIALLLRRRSARGLLLLFGVTAVHAGILTVVAPEIHDQYRETIEQSEAARPRGT